MPERDNWNERWKPGNVGGWDIGRPDFNLIDIVTHRPIQNWRALEVGCGSGDNAMWLAQRGFSVIGVDIAENAIQKAREKLSNTGLDCTFHLADFMDREVAGAPFGFVFDRGCFHSFDLEEQRKQFAKNVYSILEDGGLWLSLIGSADDPPRDVGPPRRSAEDIATAVESNFEILMLKTSHFESNSSRPPRAWVCLMQKRTQCDSAE
ncbi:class I SAM-dependent methyltransferase [Planctomycetota bacterium]